MVENTQSTLHVLTEGITFANIRNTQSTLHVLFESQFNSLYPVTFTTIPSISQVFSGGFFSYGSSGVLSANWRDYIASALFSGSSLPGVFGWMALLNSRSTQYLMGTEVTGQGYKRRPVFFNPSANGVFINRGVIQFPRQRASWGTVTSCSICTASTGSDYMFFGNLSPLTPTNDSYFRIAAGQLQLGFN